MEVRGAITRVRADGFTGRDGKRIEMLYFDVADETASLVNCEMRQNGVHLERKMEVVCTVSRLKRLKFGDQISCVVDEVKVLSSPDKVLAGSAVPVPVPSFSGPEAAHAPVGKK